jgi:hypothetical protein
MNFPGYDASADCSRTTVYSAIRALEQLGILSWVNWIKHLREYVPGLFGKGSAWRWAVQRTRYSRSKKRPADAEPGGAVPSDGALPEGRTQAISPSPNRTSRLG